MKMYIVYILLSIVAIGILGCGEGDKTAMNERFMKFVEKHEAAIKPLYSESALAYFNATTTGKDEYYQAWEAADLEMSKIYSDKASFAELKEIRDSHLIDDPVHKRELDVLYRAYLDKQIAPERLQEMIQKQALIEKEYSTFRAKIGDKVYSDNELEKMLSNETDSKKLKEIWESSKQIGPQVADGVLELVRLRNAAAKELGFKNYHAMQLELNEQNPDAIEKLFDELDDLTRDAFSELKDNIDAAQSKKYGVDKSELTPWHYENRFFQEAPKIYTVDLDQFYQDQDLVKLTEQYYGGIGLPIEDMVVKSDLFEREGKYQHAYCTDIDREGDVRVVCNVKPNYNWMNTMLHEYGHAVYDKFMDPQVPYTLREPANTFTTEAIAMLFGRFAANPNYLVDVVGVPADEAEKVAEDCYKSLRLEQLVFSRWSQVMYRFEKSMYENPEQDLNNLWWDLVEKYQMIKRPENRNQPDWASKIHVALYPAYYHNYLMGELLASQLFYHISENVLQADPAKQSFANQKAVGDYLIENVFHPAKLYYWDDMIKRATGENLSAKFYAKQFVG